VQGAPVEHLQKSWNIIAENNRMSRETTRHYIGLNNHIPALLDDMKSKNILKTYLKNIILSPSYYKGIKIPL
jgi:hypothetical protein